MLIGERLLQLRLVRRAKLGQALQAQHLYGGRIGTNLVQLGGIDLDSLATALGAHLSVPVAVESQFENTRRHVLERLPAELAARYGAVPVDETSAGTLVVGMMDPRDRDVVAAIEAAVGGRIQPCVTPELRLRYWLEKHYQIPRDARFLRGTPGESGEESPERRRVIAASPAVEPGEARLGRIATVKRRAVTAPPAAAAEDDLQLDITVDARSRSQVAEIAIGRVKKSRDGDEMAQAVCDYLTSEVDCGLLLAVRSDIAVGWKAAVPLRPEIAAQVAVPLAVPTAFRAACETGTTFRGAPPEAGRSFHERLAAMLGMRSAQQVLVVPVLASQRVPLLIYAQQKGGTPPPAQVVGDLEAIAAVVAEALARLGKASKH